MSDWINVVCTACGWEQQYPQSGSLFAFKCDKCSAGSYKWAENQASDEEEKQKVNSDRVCNVVCRKCERSSIWAESLLVNSQFFCRACDGKEYSLCGVETPPTKVDDAFIDYCPDCNTVNEVKELSDTTVCPMCYHNMKRKSLRNIVNKPVGLRSTASEPAMFDLTALDKEDLIYLVQVLAKKATKK